MLRIAAIKVLWLFYSLLPPVTYKSIYMLLGLGYWPNIRQPRTLNEKIAHQQLLAPHPLAPLVCDKWRVREYVAEKGLAHILNEVYFVTDSPETIPFDVLPDRFVIKANHGSGMNLIVTDKHTLDRQKAIGLCRKWLSRRYGRVTRSYEMHYDSIPPSILVERFLDDEQYGIPLDYKVDCFHGRAYYIGVRRITPTGSYYSRYDREWKHFRFANRGPYNGDAEFPRPAKLEMLLDAAERLSDGMGFCRVDLYLVNSTDLFFGELTLHPSGGVNPISREWDFRLGELW